MLQFKVLALFGLVNFLFIITALLRPISIAEQSYGWHQASVLLMIQGLIASAMLYAARQKFAKADIADKAYPAVIVAYVLWLCMVWRWLGQ